MGLPTLSLSKGSTQADRKRRPSLRTSSKAVELEQNGLANPSLVLRNVRPYETLRKKGPAGKKGVQMNARDRCASRPGAGIAASAIDLLSLAVKVILRFDNVNDKMKKFAYSCTTYIPRKCEVLQ